MKKLSVLLLAVVLVLSMSFAALAVSDKADKDNNGKGPERSAQAGKSSLQKEFKQELNEQKKAVAKEKRALEEQKADLEAEYQALLAAGDTAGAEALLVTINELDTQIAGLEAEMKEIINERHMVIKTLYSEEELAAFDSAAALIEQMYADAAALEAGSIVVNNGIIKLEAPAYIKGGKTMVPIRALEELGATVNYDLDAKTVTVTKDNVTVVLSVSGSTVYVDGVATEAADPYAATNGRAYVPLRFLAETLGLEVNYDGESGTIDIEEPADDETVDDGTTDDGTIDDGADDGTDESTVTE